jgi:hypothetical protein
MPEQSHDTGLSREVEPIEAPTGEVVERSEPIVVLHAENSLERLTQRHSSQHSHLQVFRKLVSWTEPHGDSPPRSAIAQTWTLSHRSLPGS